MEPNKIDFTSRDTEFISKRFLVKGSVLSIGGQDPTVMIAVQDLAEQSFRLRYFKNPLEAAQFVHMLRLVNQQP